MLLSFSHEAMRGYVESGFDQAHGLGGDGTRVKRTTIRRLGVRYSRLLDYSATTAFVPVHLWWKSRTPERKLIGEVKLLAIERIEIRRESYVGQPWLVVRGQPALFALFGEPLEDHWIEAATPLFSDVADQVLGASPLAERGLARIAYRDGFYTQRAFADYFVPKLGDRFEGVALRW